MALNIGNGFIDRKNYGKSTRLEGGQAMAKTGSTQSGKMLTIGDLKPGHEFKASVSDVNNNTIKLRLSDGQQISARIDAPGEFNIGEEITFTVKSNDGYTIDISPSKIPTEVNPTLLRALGAADLPVTDNNLAMVKSMMEEQLPIDKTSLQSMYRQVLNNPEAPIQNLVQMTKFNIPVTPENLTQFENYKNFENQISKELSKLSGELTSSLDDMTAVTLKETVAEMTNPELPQGAQSTGAGSQAQMAAPLDPSLPIQAIQADPATPANPINPAVVNGTAESIVPADLSQVQAGSVAEAAVQAGIDLTPEEMQLLNNLQASGGEASLAETLTAIKEGGTPQVIEYNDMLLDIALDKPVESEAAEGEVQSTGTPVEAQYAGNTAETLNVEGKLADNPANPQITSDAKDQQQQALIQTENAPISPEEVANQSEKPVDQVQTQVTNPTLAEELSVPQRADLANALKAIGMPQDLVNAVNAGTVTDKEALEQIKDKFNNDKGSVKQLLDQALLSNKTYQKVLSNAISKQWFLKPEQVGEEQKVANLYEKLNRQMKQVAEQTANLNNNSSNNIMKMATDTSGNMDFMNHLNQTYAYVQIPVKINGEDKQSDLYVFSNKRNLMDPDGEIKALLHLDMDALGSVDAFMKLKDTKLDTKFTLEDDLSYKLFEDHIDELITRLEAKGYNCSVKFEMGNEQIDFVEDFLKQGQSVGTLERFSFDVRA